MSEVKITVLIITYNQEKLISKTLDSLLIQKNWLYEIVVCDDYSSDNNWNVICEYSKLYPELIKPYRNEKNLGHIDNWINSWNKATGNLIYLMAGDDYVGKELFEKAHNLVKLNHIDCETDKVSIYFDFKIIYPNGKEIIFSNKLLNKEYDPISLKLRGLIWNRTVLYTKNVMKEFTPIRKDLGIYSDVLIEFQIPQNSNKIIYESYVGNIYNYGIGIASKTKIAEHWKSIILVLIELNNVYHFSKNDKRWIKYKISLRFYLMPNIIDLLKTWLYYILSRNPKYEIDLKNPFRLIKMLFKYVKK